MSHLLRLKLESKLLVSNPMLWMFSLTYLAVIESTGLGCVESQEVNYSVPCIKCLSRIQSVTENSKPTMTFFCLFVFWQFCCCLES